MNNSALPVAITTMIMALLCGCGLHLLDPNASSSSLPATGDVPANPSNQPIPSSDATNNFLSLGGTIEGLPVGHDLVLSINGQAYAFGENGVFRAPIDFQETDPYFVQLLDNGSIGGAYDCRLDRLDFSMYDTVIAASTIDAQFETTDVTDLRIVCTCAEGSLGYGSGTSNDPFIIYSVNPDFISHTGTTLTDELYFSLVCVLDFAFYPNFFDLADNEHTPLEGHFEFNDFSILNATVNP